MTVVRIIIDSSFRERGIFEIIDENSVIHFSDDPLEHSFMDVWDIAILRWNGSFSSLRKKFPFTKAFIVYSNSHDLYPEECDVFFDLNPSNLKLSFSNAIKFVRNLKELEEMETEMMKGEMYALFQGPVISRFLDELRRKFRVYGDMLLMAERGCRMHTMLRYIFGRKLIVLDFLASSESAIIFSLVGMENEPGILRSVGKGIIFLDNFHLTSRSFQDMIYELLLTKSYKVKNSVRKFVGKIILGVAEDQVDKISGKILNIIGNGKVRVPPLRERREDIPFMVDQYLSYLSQRNRRAFPPVSDLTLNLLMNYHWPRNLDEFEEVLHRYAMKGEIEILDFFKDTLASEDDKHVPNLKETLRNLTQNVEKRLIEKALRITNNNKKKASSLLGISYKTLVQKMEKFGINNR
ncbi:MAG: hypothetical protein DRP30_05740 [Thermotoga sp.]|nr:MAG: hypothetical protein DRP30_05740 [Thermotoga sp.]